MELMRRFPDRDRLRTTVLCLLVTALVGAAGRSALAQGSLSKAKQYRKAGDCLAAEKEVDQYLKFHPNDAEAHLVRAWCRVERENRLGAEESFKKALALNPNVPGAAEAKLMLKQIQDAFARPPKPPMPLRLGETGPKDEEAKETDTQSAGRGLVGSAMGSAPGAAPTELKRRGSGKSQSQLGAALDLETADQEQGKTPIWLIVGIAAGCLVIGGTVAFLIARKRADSDELVL
jgi:tetratricopeptide (TPR) repeat protein